MWMASNGQAVAQRPQVVQADSSTRIEPSAILLSAPRGQAATQGGFSHCLQTCGRSSSTLLRSTRILDFVGLQIPSCHSEQTSMQSLQPVHLPLLTSNLNFSTSFQGFALVNCPLAFAGTSCFRDDLLASPQA